MSLATKLLSASGGGVDKLYVDDVFSAFTYTGNGATRTINNGIDLAGKGGLVWLKTRNSTRDHGLFDTARGTNKLLRTNSTGAEITYATDTLTSFNANGFTVGADANILFSLGSGDLMASWTFRKAPKFFDVVTYTGTGSTRTVAHSLGSAPGMLVIKRTDVAADWQVYHRSLANTEYAVLNTAAAKATGATRWNSTTPTTSVFSVGTDTTVNATGGTYVAYLFAHDPSADGIVQCGSFSYASGPYGAGIPEISLGWEPQYILIKRTDVAEDWRILDTSRNTNANWNDYSNKLLKANSTNTETTDGNIYITSTGFGYGTLPAGSTYIYLAIRRPNKPPTLGTQVYNAIARTGTGAAATVTGVGFAPDLVISSVRANIAFFGSCFNNRLAGINRYLKSYNTAAEISSSTAVTSYLMDGFALGTDDLWSFNYSTETYIYNFFKRAPGVFDVVCYTGTGVAKTEAHSLTVVPELMIVKKRSATGSWPVRYSSAASPGYGMYLNDTSGEQNTTPVWTTTAPTSNVFSVGTSADSNTNAATYVAYLFATKAGISKCGNYTGNGTSQTINAGFTTGARFVMIKRTNATGDWYVWDTVRGLVAGNDPHLSLNTTAAEVTTNDSLDPANAGFIVNQLAATNINVTSATYIYLAFA